MYNCTENKLFYEWGEFSIIELYRGRCILMYNCTENKLFYEMGLNARKPVFGGLRTTHAQTSLRIRAV